MLIGREAIHKFFEIKIIIQQQIERFLNYHHRHTDAHANASFVLFCFDSMDSIGVVLLLLDPCLIHLSIQGLEMFLKEKRIK